MPCIGQNGDCGHLLIPNIFISKDSKAVLSLENAMTQNQMILLGDYQLGTIPPLSVRIYPDITKLHKSLKTQLILQLARLSCFATKRP